MATASDVRCRVEEVLTKIESLRQYATAEGDSLEQAEQRLQELRSAAPQDVLGQGTDNWADRDDAQKEELFRRLGSILEDLEAIELRARRPSATQRRLLLSYGIATPLVLLLLVFLPVCMGAAVDDGHLVHAAWIFLLIMTMGAVGGSLRLIGSLTYYLGRRKFYRSWLPYYYLAPLEGALIALLVCMLVFGGMFTPPPAAGPNANNAGEPQQDTDGQPVADGPSPPPDLQADGEANADEGSGGNKVSVPAYLYALAGLSGLFAKNVMRKLRDLADSLFGKPSQSDAA